MTAQKSNTGKRRQPLAAARDPAPVPDYDVRRLFPKEETQEYLSVTLRGPGSDREEILVPVRDGQTEEETRQSALAYLQARRRVLKMWAAADLTSEQLAHQRKGIINVAAMYGAIQIVQIIPERFGVAGIQALYGPEVEALAALEMDMLNTLGLDSSEVDLDSEEAQARLSDAEKAELAAVTARLEAASDRALDAATESLERLLGDAPELLASIDHAIDGMEYDAVTAVLMDFEEEYGDAVLDMGQEQFDQLFKAMMEQGYDARRGNLTDMTARTVARVALEYLQAGSRPLEELMALLGSPTAGNVEEVARAGITQELHMLADRTLDRIARVVAGKEEPVSLIENNGLVFHKLEDVKTKSGRKAHVHLRQDAPVYVIAPDTARPILERLERERNEVKAKTLLACVALANHPDIDNPEEFEVDLHDLVTLITNRRRSGKGKTQSDLYWRTVAQVIRNLYDLAAMQVNIDLTRSKYHSKKVDRRTQVIGEYLMHRPRLISDQPMLYDMLYEHLADMAASSDTPEDKEAQRNAMRYLKQVKPTDARLGFPGSVIRALGYDEKSTENINRDVFQLEGPVFWLSQEVMHLRRYTRRQKQALADGVGRSLLEELEKRGFLEASIRRTGGRVSYTHALTEYFQAVATLEEMGELDHPGVTVWKMHGTRRMDQKATLARWIGTRGKHIREEDLEPLKVRYALPKVRIDALEAAREKAKKRQS